MGTEILTPKQIKGFGDDLFRLAQILEEFAENEKGFNDKVFASIFAQECHNMHSKIEELFDNGYFDDMLNSVELESKTGGKP